MPPTPCEEPASDGAPLPSRLAETVELLGLLPDREERIQLLIDTAERFEEVPESVAARPFGEDHRVPACESEAFVWATDRPDGTLDFHFAVDNPQGISAMSLAVILGETLSGETLEAVARVPADVIYKIFGRELSMGKSMGLMGMVNMVRTSARKRLAGTVSDPRGSKAAESG